MPTQEQIKELVNYYKTDLYATVRREQDLDRQYRDDTFSIPEVREPHKVLRLGVGSRMVDAPAEQIVTSNPQATFTIIKGSKDISAKLSEVVNKVWLPLLRLQNPNPFKESLKNKLCRGESYIRLAANPNWTSKDEIIPERYRGLPVLFNLLDPMVIYGSPQENDCGWYPECGIPNNVIVIYERHPVDVMLRYPGWTNPKQAGINRDKSKQITWIEYWDKSKRYFEADGEPVLSKEQERNPYGFVPFIRKPSGFGKISPSGELADLIVSDLRWNRDLIKELCIMASDISSRLHLSAHKPKTLMSPGEVNEENIRENLAFGAYDLNILQNVPAGTRFLEDKESGIAPVTGDEFQHYRDTWTMLTQRNPFLLSGFPFGTSGRQQDMTTNTAMRRYDAPLENTQLEFATAIEMALDICRTLELIPSGLTKKDLEADFACSVFLRAADPVEEDRKITLGDRLYQTGTISLKTYLMEYRGLPEDKAMDEIANILVDKLTISNPDVAAVMGMAFAEESGMMDWINKAKMAQQAGVVQSPMGSQGRGQAGLGLSMTPNQQQRAAGETQTPMGTEMGTEPNRGARNPPQRYTR